jgi:hypothetical protein
VAIAAATVPELQRMAVLSDFGTTPLPPVPPQRAALRLRPTAHLIDWQGERQFHLACQLLRARVPTNIQNKRRIASNTL